MWTLGNDEADEYPSSSRCLVYGERKMRAIDKILN
jgi:hypothetical protein